jgi:recombination protein RecR
MKEFSPAVRELVEALRALPGVGPRTAQRMTFFLLRDERHEARRLAAALERVLLSVGRCRDCRMYCEEETCELCRAPRRNRALLCVVESPADLMAFEATGRYDGLYFVLFGHLSPLDGVGPEELGLGRLRERLRGGVIREVILATNPTVEGEATAQVIAGLCAELGVPSSRLAHGVPAGGELEYLDGATLGCALDGRRPYAA